MPLDYAKLASDWTHTAEFLRQRKENGTTLLEFVEKTFKAYNKNDPSTNHFYATINKKQQTACKTPSPIDYAFNQSLLYAQKQRVRDSMVVPEKQSDKTAELEEAIEVLRGENEALKEEVARLKHKLTLTQNQSQSLTHSHTTS